MMLPAVVPGFPNEAVKCQNSLTGYLFKDVMNQLETAVLSSSFHETTANVVIIVIMTSETTRGSHGDQWERSHSRRTCGDTRQSVDESGRQEIKCRLTVVRDGDF